MTTCAIVSFRLGLTDGVSVVAAAWQRLLEGQGFDVLTVAGDGPVDRRVPGLAIAAPAAPAIGELTEALADADLVIVENLLTIPLNVAASRALAEVLSGRPAILHHHDPPWQRPHLAHVTELPATDPAWRHVVITDHTRDEFAERGIEAVRIYNGFDTDGPQGERDQARAALGLGDDVLALHPVRAIPRKNIPGALALCEALDATYWLPGPAEDGYDAELARLLEAAACPVRRSPMGPPADAYAAADVVVFPSTWEGFGNPPVEAAIHGRPAVVGHYPASDELRRLGLVWFEPDDVEAVARYLAAPDGGLVEQNRRVVEEHLSLPAVGAQLSAVVDDLGRHA